MKFGERHGFKPEKQPLASDEISESLKTAFWNLLFKRIYRISDQTYFFEREKYLQSFWEDILERAIDTIPRIRSGYDVVIHSDEAFGVVREWYFSNKRQWFDYYELMEFTIQQLYPDMVRERFSDELGYILIAERAPYRLIKGRFVQITDNLELDTIIDTLSETDKLFKEVRIHLQTGLLMLSDKKNPDFRNSVKESISAVESICKVLSGSPGATMSTALQKLNLHAAMRDGFIKLYAYTSDEGGIRHSLADDSRTVSFQEAKYMLVTCCAFVNFLKAEFAVQNGDL